MYRWGVHEDDAEVLFPFPSPVASAQPAPTMPKNKRHPPPQQLHSRHAYPACLRHTKKKKKKDRFESSDDWVERVCPICLESPHNAVLFFCESIDRGCRPFICNTSYRHSNCLDQYLKSCGCSRNSHSPSQVLVDPSVFSDFMRVSSGSSSSHVDGDASNRGSDHSFTSQRNDHSFRSVRVAADRDRFRTASRIDRDGRQPSWLRILTQEFTNLHSSPLENGIQNLQCPLCRGNVMGWGVIDVARKYFDERIRVCSRENCTFVGTYRQLRAHARGKHPLARPCQADPVRQREWQQLEQQRIHGDVLSSINAEMPGATIYGDYLIEDDDFFVDDGFELEGESMSEEDMPDGERLNTQQDWRRPSFLDDSMITRGYSSVQSGRQLFGDHQSLNIELSRRSTQSGRQLLGFLNQEHNIDSERRQHFVNYHHSLDHEEDGTSDSDDGSNNIAQTLG